MTMTLKDVGGFVIDAVAVNIVLYLSTGHIIDSKS